MECKNCTLKKVCKVNELIQSFEGDIGITINSCNYKTKNTNTATTIIEAKELAVDNSAFLADNFDQEEYNRLLSKMNNEEVDDINNTIIECKTCGGKDYLSELRACSSCGTEICGNCGTSDNGRNYCQKCWEEL